jgi:hypothetical protein
VIHESVTGALREARDSLARLTGQQVGTQQLMQTVMARCLSSVVDNGY